MNYKSVLFVTYSMGIGGVEKALLGVVDKFVGEGWDVHIAYIKPWGEFMKYLPEKVTVHKVEGFKEVKPLLHTPMRLTVVDSLRHGRLFRAFYVALCLIDGKINGGAARLYRYGFRNVPRFNDTVYDLAIAFAGPDAFIDSYVDRCVRAKEKWGWIHFDISKFGTDRSIVRDCYRRYSRINVVSRQAKEIFDSRFPQFADKTVFTPNVVNESSILDMAKEAVELPDAGAGRVRILTVGRISREKGQLTALKALRRLVDGGVANVEWWFVGDGNDIDRCREYVAARSLEDHVRFFGAKANPYPYMARCDIYMQPSLHEGYCITLAEAKLFGKPIVATDFTGAREQLAAYPDGYVASHDPAEIARLLQSIIVR